MEIFFDDEDSGILYAIPEPPSDVLTIVASYMFLNRTAAPSYERLQQCLTKAINAGIVHLEGDKFKVDGKWYMDIHIKDDCLPNEIEAMIDFSERFTPKGYPAINDRPFPLTRSEYDALLKGLGS